MKPQLYLGIIFALGWTGCVSDAPHENPLDPAIAGSNQLQISGKVEHLNSSAPVTEALLFLKPGNRVAQSDMNGIFNISGNIAPGPYTLVCKAEGFAADSLSFRVRQDTTVSFKLNALPAFERISLTTDHETTFLPPDNFFLNIDILASDVDALGNIELVWFDIPAIGHSDTLQELAAAQGQRFFKRIEASDLRVNSLKELIGKPLEFYARDEQGAVAESGERYLTRIIDDPPRPVAPINPPPQPPVSVPFHFEWEFISEPFHFDYAIEIYLNVPVALPPEAQISGIPADSTGYFFNPPSFSAGEYYWVLYIVDEFGNRSRSRQTVLTIE